MGSALDYCRASRDQPSGDDDPKSQPSGKTNDLSVPEMIPPKNAHTTPGATGRTAHDHTQRVVWRTELTHPRSCEEENTPVASPPPVKNLPVPSSLPAHGDNQRKETAIVTTKVSPTPSPVLNDTAQPTTHPTTETTPARQVDRWQQGDCTIHVYEGHRKSQVGVHSAVAIAFNSRYIASGCKNKTVKLYSVDDPAQCLHTWTLPGPVGTLAMNENQLYIGTQKNLYLVSLSTVPTEPVMVQSAAKDETILCMSISERHCAVGFSSGAVSVWQLDSSTQIFPPRGQTHKRLTDSAVTCIHIGGDYLCLGTKSERIEVHTVASLGRVPPLLIHIKRVPTSLCVTPKFLVFGMEKHSDNVPDDPKTSTLALLKFPVNMTEIVHFKECQGRVSCVRIQDSYVVAATESSAMPLWQLDGTLCSADLDPNPPMQKSRVMHFQCNREQIVAACLDGSVKVLRFAP